MNQVLANLQAFAASHQGVLTLLGFAAVVNMPAPGKNPLYRWIYGTLQSFTSAIKPHPEQAHIVTSQETPQGTSKSDATFPVNPIPPAAPANQQ